jgi:hypothetical protein
MTEDEETQRRLGEALNRLHAFAATFNSGDYVDEESGLTTDDMNLMLTMLERVHANAKCAPER